jgi:hypothetical protein
MYIADVTKAMWARQVRLAGIDNMTERRENKRDVGIVSRWHK